MYSTAKILLRIQATTLITFALLFPSPTHADPPFGIGFVDEAQAGANDFYPIPFPGSPDWNLPQISDFHAFSISSIGSTCIFQGSICGGSLHAVADASVAPNSLYAEMDITEFFFDTFTISGPSGHSGQFQVDLTFDGAMTRYDPGSQFYALTCYFCLDQNGYENQVGAAIGMQPGTPVHETNSVVLTLSSGSTVTLGEDLEIRIAGQGVTAAGQVSIDVENCFIRVTALSAGFGFSTASGLNYSSKPDASVASIVPAASMVSPGQCALQFTGNTNAGYTVLSSTNLAWPLTNWSNLGAPRILPNGTFQFIDTLATNSPEQFYLLQSP